MEIEEGVGHIGPVGRAQKQSFEDTIQYLRKEGTTARHGPTKVVLVEDGSGGDDGCGNALHPPRACGGGILPSP